MQTFKAGAPTSVSVPFLDDNGNQLEPTALSYRIVDEAGTEVVASTSIGSFDVASGEVTIQVTGAQNAVPAGSFGGYRRVEVTMTHPAGVQVKDAGYLLRAESALALMENSFQSYEQALVLSMQLGQLNGWSGASDEARKGALARAFDNLCSFSYRMIAPNEQTAENDSYFGSFRAVSAEEFESLLPSQQADFRKAQVVEADYLLGGNPIEKMIADGEQSSTIGEVSKFFRPRASLVLPISRAARSYVGRYIVWSRPLGRS